MGDSTTLSGLMVDNAVEFEVVTVDGEVRTINECVATGLFWAMRGVDAATFDVLTKYRVQLYPALPIHTYTSSPNSAPQAMFCVKSSPRTFKPISSGPKRSWHTTSSTRSPSAPCCHCPTTALSSRTPWLLSSTQCTTSRTSPVLAAVTHRTPRTWSKQGSRPATRQVLSRQRFSQLLESRLIPFPLFANLSAA